MTLTVPAVCPFKTCPCVPAPRRHVVTHVRVVPVHTGTFSMYTRERCVCVCVCAGREEREEGREGRRRRRGGGRGGNTCARGVGTHGDVLNVHTGTF